MKTGFWGNYQLGIWIEIDEHEQWLRRGGNAVRLGIPESAVARFREFPCRETLLRFVLANAPVMRWRCHGESVTFEFDSDQWRLPLQLAETWCKLFAGPFLGIRMVNLRNTELRETRWKDFHELSD